MLWGLAGRAPPPLGDLEQAVYELVVGGELSDETLDLLSTGDALIANGNESVPEKTQLAIQTAAAVGYLTRRAEVERYLAAREPGRPLDDYVNPAAVEEDGHAEQSGEALAARAAEMAAAEPVDPSAGDAHCPSFAIPGLSVESRARLREETLKLAARPDDNGGLVAPHGALEQDVTLDDLRRAWKFGYFLRRLEELAEA